MLHLQIHTLTSFVKRQLENNPKNDMKRTLEEKKEEKKRVFECYLFHFLWNFCSLLSEHNNRFDHKLGMTLRELLGFDEFFTI